jgi:biotin operon repressor
VLALRHISGPSARARVRPVPGVECCFALWLAGAPEPEPLRPAAQALRDKLPDRLQRSARRLDSRLPGWPLRAANWFYRTPEDDYAPALRALRGESAARLGFDLLANSILGHTGPVDSRQRLAATTASVLRRPEQVVYEAMEVIDGFWRAGFGSLWDRQRARAEAASAHLRARAERNFPAALTALSPRAVHDRESDELRFVGGQGEWSIDCDKLEGVDVVPSVWLRRRVVLLLSGERIGIGIGIASRERRRLTCEDLIGLLVALAEPRRFDIVRLCLQESLCTQEIASRLGITEAPVSRHLKELERQGIVVGQRFGRRVTYTAIPETVALLGDALSGLADHRRIEAPAAGRLETPTPDEPAAEAPAAA